MSSSQPSNRLLGKKDFLVKYKITNREFEKTDLKWPDLQAIFDDYSKLCNQLKENAEILAAELRQCPQIHATKSRTKKPESLIEKIIRKSVKNGSPWAFPSTYIRVVPDLIGIRGLYLFQEQWPIVDNFIRLNLSIKIKPMAYIQKPIPARIRSAFIKAGCKVEIGKDGYQSVHYETRHKIGIHQIRVEIQTRTLYQEAWGEISHVIAYPYKQNVSLLVKSMTKLAKFTAKDDHFSSIIKGLSELYDARESNQQPDPEVHASYKELLDFLLINHPDTVGELAKASSEVSIEKVSSSLGL
jgi:GTP pyrophosphokinase